MSDHFDLLISDYLDDQLDGAGLAELEAWLDADREHRRRFLRMAQAHRALLDQAKTRAAASSDASAARAVAVATKQAESTGTGAWRARGPNQQRPSARLRGMSARRRAVSSAARPWTAMAAVAAAVLVLALVASRSTGARVEQPVAHHANPAPTPTQPAAQPTGNAFAVVAAASAATLDGKPLAADATLASGAHVVVAVGGAIAFRCPDGTLMRGDGGAEFTVADGASGKRVAIARGRVSADVSPQPAGRPLVLGTGDADVTVVGTSLAVASLDGETRAEVTHGRVTLTRRADGASVAIDAGHYALCTAGSPLIAHALGEPSGKTYEVGAGAEYARFADLPALSPGDLVLVRPGGYREAFRCRGDGTALRPITVRGAGAARSVIDGQGIALSGAGAEPRCLFQVEGSHWAIEDLGFAHARIGDQAGAVRAVAARAITVRGVHVVDCNRGLDLVCDDTVISDCDIADCGVRGGDGSSHGIGVTGKRAVIERCDVRDIVGGQGVRCMAGAALIADCRFARAEDGELTIGRGEGSDIAVVGTLLRGGNRRNGSYTRFIVVEEEGADAHCSLRLIGDTFVAADQRTIFITSYGKPVQASADGCIFVGSAKLTDQPALALTGREDWLPAGLAVPAGMSDVVQTDDPGFMDAGADDFRLRAASPCVGRGPIALAPPGFPAVDRVAMPGPGATPLADPRRWIGAVAPR